MQGLRSQKSLIIVLIALISIIYYTNSGNSHDTWAEIKNFQVNYQPGLIKADVHLQNKSRKTQVFEAFSLHCTNANNRDVTFKIINNEVGVSQADIKRIPIKLEANSSLDMSLIAEINEFYRSEDDCYTAAISWKIKNGSNYYGESILVNNP